ncbi:hypothetical protein ZEAMMB73_Zm00001d029403 [Zea mays]|uniref:Uncharacterized protein n=1 Tax=Zea mays TaxID=4577 RepID=A0A1D6K4Y0_MAIZE|nr:hypothetical protein ZEAMMB73_Zm00001d029403 [Zea mays]
MAVVEACDPARIDISSKTAAPSERTTQLISGGRHVATPPLPPRAPADACLALLVDRLSLSSVVASRLSRTHKDAPNVLNLSYRVRTQLSGKWQAPPVTLRQLIAACFDRLYTRWLKNSECCYATRVFMCILTSRTQGPFINCLMWKEGVMIFCCFCSEKLKEGEDIYIYQGDKSFCSMECRENFMVDEMEGKGGWKHLFCMGAAWRELIGRKQTLTRFLNVPREKGINWDLLFIQGKKERFVQGGNDF